MRAGPNRIPPLIPLAISLAISLATPLAIALAGIPAEARPDPGHHRHAASDMDRTLARMAGRDRLRNWRAWQAPRSPALAFAPITRERVAAPPFTGWGYGGTVPGAWPGF